MSNLAKEKVVLSDGVILSTHPDDFITNVIKKSKNYYEIKEILEFKQFVPGKSVVYDIGANIGNHSVYFGKYLDAKKIYSFEPVKDTFELLKENVVNNAIHQAEVFQIGVGNKSGKARVLLDEKNLGASKLEYQTDGNIDMVTIDELQLSPADFVKIDVEGSELLVLEGMASLLENHEPVLWIEINDNFSVVHEYLRSFEYVLIHKMNFNHIFKKVHNEEEKSKLTNMFVEKIVVEYNSVLLDKWKLNNWLIQEKIKIAKLNDDVKNQADKYNIQITQLENDMKEKNSELAAIEERLDNAAEALTQTRHSYLQYRNDMSEELLKHIELERRNLENVRLMKDHYAIMESRYNRLKSSLPGRIFIKLFKYYKRFK